MRHVQIGRYRTFLPHSSCIWDVVSLPDRFHSTCVNSVPRGESFATCSADGSIRLWHLDLGHDDTSEASPIHSSSDNARPQNVYNKDILGVLYIGFAPALSARIICDMATYLCSRKQLWLVMSVFMYDCSCSYA